MLVGQYSLTLVSNKAFFSQISSWTSDSNAVTVCVHLSNSHKLLNFTEAKAGCLFLGSLLTFCSLLCFITHSDTLTGAVLAHWPIRLFSEMLQQRFAGPGIHCGASHYCNAFTSAGSSPLNRACVFSLSSLTDSFSVTRSQKTELNSRLSMRHINRWLPN